MVIVLRFAPFAWVLGRGQLTGQIYIFDRSNFPIIWCSVVKTNSRFLKSQYENDASLPHNFWFGPKHNTKNRFTHHHHTGTFRQCCMPLHNIARLYLMTPIDKILPHFLVRQLSVRQKLMILEDDQAEQFRLYSCF